MTFSKFYNLYSLLSWQHDLHVSSSYYFLFSINLWSGITKSKVCHWCGYQIQQIWYHISFTIDATFTSSWIQQINSPIHVSFIFYEWISHGLCKPCNLDKFVNARAVQGVVLEVFQPCNSSSRHNNQICPCPWAAQCTLQIWAIRIWIYWFLQSGLKINYSS